MKKKAILDSSTIQFDLTKIMFVLESIISKKIKNLKDKSEEQKTKFLLQKVVF